MKEKFIHFSKKTFHFSKSSLWFLVGFLISGLTLLSLIIIFFQYTYHDKTIPGIFVENTYIGEKTKDEIKYIYEEKNKKIGDSKFTFTLDDKIATISAHELNIGYDSELIATQADSLGKASNIFSNFFIITNAYLNGINLDPAFTYDETKLAKLLQPFEEKARKEPVNAEFTIENNKVVEFTQSKNGEALDSEKIKKYVLEKIPTIIRSDQPKMYDLSLPITSIEPDITTNEANSYGIVEEIGHGVSYFRGSIPNRIHNIGHAASKIDGTLVPPGEEFSFNEHIGDISRLSGYKEAYVISGGRTVLGDGGGVCQVSTTLFRAMLDAGVPITERHAHSYRVGYYEQGSPLGIDATIYVPSVDLKFKNDTGNYILIKSNFSAEEQMLEFTFFGKSDGRIATVTEPVILSTSSAPPPLYEDDPTLPIGETKQVDFAASGAYVQFSRTVVKDGKVIIDETFSSRYSPWQAVYKVGTKQG